jgi:hypothetical protein
MRVEGQCHCGAIKYEAEVTPGSIAICHCSDCQMLTGSVFRANIAAPAEHFHILSGQPRLYIKTSDRGNRRVHAFCGDCGAPVYSCAPEHPTTYSLRLGALKQRFELGRPMRETWVKRRFDWIDEIDGASQCEGQPD